MTGYRVVLPRPSKEYSERDQQNNRREIQRAFDTKLDKNEFEQYKANGGGGGGGGTGSGMPTGGGTDQVFYENIQNVNTSYTIPDGKNAGTFGPITISANAVVTVPANGTWVIV